MLSENAKKWKKTGLLDGLNEIDCEILTQNLVESAHCLIQESNKNQRMAELKAGLFLPIVSRLFRAGHRILNIRGLYDDFSLWYNSRRELAEIIGDLDTCELYYDYICREDRINQFYPE